VHVLPIVQDDPGKLDPGVSIQSGFFFADTNPHRAGITYAYRLLSVIV
jgi:hypothetical protein